MLIDVHQLRVSYDGTEILHGIDLRVEEGEFVSIVGKSGCGKSTLLLALAGFIAREGDVQFPREFGMVFQNYAVFPWMTVRDNIAFGLGRLPQQEQAAVVARHLSLVGLESHAAKFPSQLSGGQAQRVALARALAPGPKVILMDEPFGALDMFTRNQMQLWLEEFWERESKTVLFVSHNIEEAIFLSDRIILMEGRIRGDTDVKLKRPRTGDLRFSTEFVELRRSIVEQFNQPAEQANQPAQLGMREGGVRVFLSYRRADSAATAGRIHDRLVEALGVDRVFKDVDSIPPGSVVGSVVKENLSATHVFIAVVGPEWEGALDDHERSRMWHDVDWIRLEVEEAIRQQIAILPLLVEDAEMPPASRLPPSIRSMTERNALRVRNDPDFHRDMDRVIEAVQALARAQHRRPADP